MLASTNYRTSIVTGGQAIITAANGDRLFLKFGGSGVATPFGFNDAFVYIITGGTGRFAQLVRGGGVIHSVNDPGTPPQIPFHLDLEGVISSVGSSKK